ncbi:Os04g0528400 [Oryza sativa Japonica Group]|uniref:Os04g0528400 protein n=1 Tax=Oryza sativa subsp. japonica TaxID=39947 RepID=A0A0P0WCP2_ORYSJ|nr:hypothetical protein EE612_024543 [Oryza sativa]BAS90183.1 Os04g0528400 [Oryza sativa Japonica Group]
MPAMLGRSRRFCRWRGGRACRRARTPRCWAGGWRRSPSSRPWPAPGASASRRTPTSCAHDQAGITSPRSVQRTPSVSSAVTGCREDAYLSRPLVGSSRKRRRGRMRSSRAMLTRRFSPPLTPRRCQLPMTVSAQSWRPISTMVPSTRARLSSRGILSGSRSIAEYPIVSRTVSVPIKLSSCVTYA